MDPTSPDVLGAVGRAHLASAAPPPRALDDARAASLCEGWTRGHVLTHVARNADGLAALVRSAVDGTGETMYASPEQRDADIEAGADRPVARAGRRRRGTAPTPWPSSSPASVPSTPRCASSARPGCSCQGAGHPVHAAARAGLPPRRPRRRLRLRRRRARAAAAPPRRGGASAARPATPRSTSPCARRTATQWTVGAGTASVSGNRGRPARLARPRTHRRRGRRPSPPTPRRTVTTMTYTGHVVPGGPTDIRRLDRATIRKMSVSEMHNNVYLVTCNGHRRAAARRRRRRPAPLPAARPRGHRAARPPRDHPPALGPRARAGGGRPQHRGHDLRRRRRRRRPAGGARTCGCATATS